MTIDAKEYLEKFCDRLEPLIARRLQKAEREATKVSPIASEAVRNLSEFTMRKAKRLRPALLYYTYKMMGGKNEAEVLKTSAFVEVLQSYLLVHDDVMDRDVFRRGGPTMHKIYETKHRRGYTLQDPVHYGESMAINIGDIACHLACEILAESNFSDAIKVRAMSKLHEQIVTVGYGQMLDVLSAVNTDTEQADVLKIHQYKTATYTYETPISIGALLAGASDAEVKILSKYAIPAGIAFQIQDDILGLFGDEDKLGKPNISDLREGKRTLLILKALENATSKDIQIIEQALGNPNISQRMAGKVRKIVIDTGSLDYSIDLAKQYVMKAKRALRAMPNWNGEGRGFLEGIADYMINREF